MLITKFKNGNINLKLEKEDFKQIREDNKYEYILYNDDLFFSDISFDTFGNEWWYLVDYSTGLVYMFTDYAFNYFDELLNGKLVKLVPCGNIEEYQEELEC